jgi:hypothetical protein
MADVVITSFGPSPQTIAPGESTTATVEAFDPDNRTTFVKATIGNATAIMQLSVADVPIPAPTFTEVDAAGEPVATPTLQLTPDPSNPFMVHITALPVA